MSSSSSKEDLWKGLSASARARLETRDYSKGDLAQRLATTGVEARELVNSEGLESVWIPGVEIFARKVWPQHHRGYFGEFARSTEGRLHEIGLWPRQWATATMYAGTAKGFHIHPPHIPEGHTPEDWFKKLYLDEPKNYAARPYDKEQWDSMFFVQGTIEFLLVDERAGMERRVMRFIIEGDNIPGGNNIGLVIPAGVAHALRCGSSENVIMVYGTSTTFVPAYEGRIASGVEQCPLPADWQDYLNAK